MPVPIENILRCEGHHWLGENDDVFRRLHLDIARGVHTNLYLDSPASPSIVLVSVAVGTTE